MHFPLSIFGIIIVSVFYFFCIFPLVFIWRRIRQWKYRWWLFAPLVLSLLILPVSDELWISYRFNEVCKDAGVHVSRKVAVEGYYDTTIRSGYDVIDNYGFKFMEHRSVEEGKIGHVTKINGEWKETILDHPTARYYYRYADPRQWVPIGLQLYKWETQIVDSKTGEIISREISYSRYPGFIEGLWIRFLGSGQEICNRPLDDKEHRTLIGSPEYHTFIPVNKQQGDSRADN